MFYAYIDDVREWIPEVTSSIVSDDSIAYFINVAENNINDVLRDRYDVPFTTVPSSISTLCARYAAYLVLQTFPDANIEDDLERTWAELKYVLDGYRTGELSLDDAYLTTEQKEDEYFLVSSPDPKYSKDLVET